MIDTDPTRLEAKLSQVAEARRFSPDDVRRRSLVGTPDEIVGQLKSLEELGVDHIILSLRAPYNHDELALFGREVIPATR